MNEVNSLESPVNPALRSLTEFVGWSCTNQKAVSEMKTAGVVAVIYNRVERKIDTKTFYVGDVIRAFRSRSDAVKAVIKLSSKRNGICYLD